MAFDLVLFAVFLAPVLFLAWVFPFDFLPEPAILGLPVTAFLAALVLPVFFAWTFLSPFCCLAVT